MKCPKCNKPYLRRQKTTFGNKKNPKMYYHYIHKEHLALGFNFIDESCFVKIQKR